MDQSLVANLREIASRLLLEGSNLISGGGGNDHEGFRLSYLRWRDGIEDLFNRSDVPVEEIAVVQSPRHRDIVSDRVPTQQLYREIKAEIELMSRLTRQVVESFDSPTESVVQIESASPQIVEFRSDHDRLYRFDQRALIGTPGQYGSVYEGWDDTGHPVAIKRVVLQASSARRLAENARLAEREVVIGNALLPASSHLMPLLDTGHREHDLLLVMPRATRSLADYIRDCGPFTSDTVAQVVIQIATGLIELAAGSIVHRDVKPSNILEYGGRWCLADFGISRILTEATATLTFQGTGTLEYRAPELWNGDPERVASDLYALGCIAVELLTGRKPFPGPEFKQQHQARVPELPSETDPSLAALIMDLLAKNPGARTPDARSVVDALAPRAGLTSGQRGLQALKARSSLRREQRSAAEALVIEQHQRRAAAKSAFDAIWRQVVTSVREAVPDAEAMQDRDGNPVICVADINLKATFDQPEHENHDPDVVFLGELIVEAPRHLNDDDWTEKSAGKLICIWLDDGPRWQVEPASQIGTSPATPNAIIELLVSSVGLPAAGEGLS